MQSAKTLWILDVPYEDIKGSLLVPLYAEDEQEAWMEAQRWALRCERTLPTRVYDAHVQYAHRAERGKHKRAERYVTFHLRQ